MEAYFLLSRRPAAWLTLLMIVLAWPGFISYSAELSRSSREAAFMQSKADSSDGIIHLDVATIRESAPGSTGVHIGFSGRRFIVSNATVSDLLRYLFKLNAKQINSTSTWISSTKYDITAITDADKLPTQAQWLGVLQELMVSRFGLKYHNETHEAFVYILNVANKGPKLTNSASPSSLPDLRLSGAGDLKATNATMKDVVQLFQGVILDRPVVDRTHLVGSFDFELKWTTDDSQYDGRFSNLTREQMPNDNQPGLSTALKEQLGLSLKTGRANIPTIMIDQLHSPTPN